MDTNDGARHEAQSQRMKQPRTQPPPVPLLSPPKLTSDSNRHDVRELLPGGTQVLPAPHSFREGPHAVKHGMNGGVGAFNVETASLGHSQGVVHNGPPLRGVYSLPPLKARDLLGEFHLGRQVEQQVQRRGVNLLPAVVENNLTKKKIDVNRVLLA